MTTEVPQEYVPSIVSKHAEKEQFGQFRECVEQCRAVFRRTVTGEVAIVVSVDCGIRDERSQKTQGTSREDSH